MPFRTLGAATLVVVCSTAGALLPASPAQVPTQAPAVVTSAAATLPLAGRTIVIDPGHQLGNHNYPRQISRLVPAGGFRKPCNTTGTATQAGFPEPTLTIRVSRLLRQRLVDLGARVVMTRTRNRQDLWGPCVDERGRAGNAIEADLKISIHGDGSTVSGARGFHVIRPTSRAGWPTPSARRCATSACRWRTTSPAGTGWTRGATSARSTSPTSRWSWSSWATCATAPTPGG